VTERARPRALPLREASAHHRLGVLATLYGYRLFASLLLAAPIAVVVQGALGGHPRGDLLLFDAGGLHLVELMRIGRPVFGGAAVLLTLGLAVASMVGLVPLAAMLVAMGSRGRWSVASLLAQSTRPLGALILLYGLALFAQVVLVGFFGFFGVMVVRGITTAGPGRDVALLVSMVLPLSILTVLGVVHDLARVQVVCRHKGILRALRLAFRAVRRRSGSLVVAWSSRALAALAALFCGLMIARHLGLGESGSFLLGATIHQVVLLFAVAARVSWLAAAMRLSEDDEDEPILAA